MNSIADFEKKVLEGLRLCDIAVPALTAAHPLGVAVSGGADSVSLLCALVTVCGAEKLRVLTVNHRLRAASETDGDARFVMERCAQWGVAATCVALAPGEVVACAKARGRGTEEAARYLRYVAFDQFVRDEQLCALCLAHTQNDMAETLVMRFLQGSGAEGGFGIARRRGSIVRPLLEVTRAEIESYLRAKQILWRTDKTNADTSYLRNRIRQQLIPHLHEVASGWQTAVMHGAEKAYDDNEALQFYADRMPWTRSGQTLCMDAQDFFSVPRAVRRRMLFTACTLLGVERFPYQVVRTVLDWQEQAAQKRRISAHGIEISADSAKILVKKHEKMATESGFLAILQEDGGTVCLHRSVQPGDCVRTKDGAYKAVQKILSGWHVRAEDKNRIPVVQNLTQPGQPIVAILGSAVGYSDWIVR